MSKAPGDVVEGTAESPSWLRSAYPRRVGPMVAGGERPYDEMIDDDGNIRRPMERLYDSIGRNRRKGRQGRHQGERQGSEAPLHRGLLRKSDRPSFYANSGNLLKRAGR